MPNTFDFTTWQLNHTSLLNQIRSDLEAKGSTVFTEGQNSFALRGQAATLGGKPDLITVSGKNGTIYDAKTGKPSPSHHVQVMVYMYAVPRVLSQYKGVTFDGKLIYTDHEVNIPSTAVDQSFIKNLGELIRRVADKTPARKVPSPMECGFCNIAKSECPERVAGDVMQQSETEDF